MFKNLGAKIASFGHSVIDTITGKKHTPSDPEGNLPHELSSWIPKDLPVLPRWTQPERADTSNYLHVSKEADTILTLGSFTARLPAPKGVTYNKGVNAAKRYVERLASNNKEKRMLRSRLKRRMNELAADVVAA